MSVLPSFRLHRFLLLLGSTVATLAFIILKNAEVLPFDTATFFFFSFVLLLFALYRLGWAFLLFIGTVPLEIINIAPDLFGGLMLRPYQWLTGIILLAVGIRFVVHRLPFRMFRPQYFDALPVLIVLGAFVAAFWAPVPALALKQAVVATSFAAVYFLGRIFLRTFFDVRQTIPFFILSSTIVFGYAIWQNVRFAIGQTSFQVMAGRPNGTFEEADWLGMFAVLALGVALVLLAWAWSLVKEIHHRDRARWLVAGAETYLILVMIVLMISVARSAWLGACALIAVFMLGLLLRRGIASLRQSVRETLPLLLSFALAFFMAAGSVWMFHLSPFQFLNRIESTGSGWQKITVSCYSADTALPQKIESEDELTQNGCRHINLEEIESEKQSGRSIREVYRPDPNVAIRQAIYRQVGHILKEHPLGGIGFGSTSLVLGTDERGAGLNASNIFLEIWLGSGLVGLVAFVIFWCLQGVRSWQWYHKDTGSSERLFALFLLATLFGMTIFNLFNSGLFLGFFFTFLAFGALVMEMKSPSISQPENI